jgi:hypothetical protein
VKQVVDLHQAQIRLTASRYDSGLLVMVSFTAHTPTSEKNKTDYNSLSEHRAINNEMDK